MEITIRDAAELIGGIITGNPDAVFSNISRIEYAQAGDITLLYLPAYYKYLKTTNATAVIIKSGIERTNPDITYIEVADPSKALLKIVFKYFSPDFPLSGIDASASVHPNAKLGANVSLGKNVVVAAGCIIGENTKIFHNSVIMENAIIGRDCLLHPNVTVREGCVLGNNVILQPGVVVGSDGFGYNPDKNGVFQKIPQIGNVILEDYVELGANTAIDRAAFGSTIIKKGTKLDNLVQVGHNAIIGENTVISGQTGVSGSTKVGNNCMIGGQVGLAGHIEIADKVMIAAQSGVPHSITDAGRYFGSPVKSMNQAMKLERHILHLPDYAEKIKILEEKIVNLEIKLNKNDQD